MDNANKANDDIEWEKCEWGKCDRCLKWRKLPPDIGGDNFPKRWECSMNTWKLSVASCDAPQEEEDTQHDVNGTSELQLRQNDNSFSDSSDDESSNNNDSGGSVYEDIDEEDSDDDELIDVLNDIKLDDQCDSWPVPPLPLSDRHKVTELSKIKDVNNAALQKLMYDFDDQYTLFDHQFEAVRKVPGVPESFPFHQGNAIQPIVKDTWQQWKDKEDQLTQEMEKYETLASHDENDTSMFVQYSDHYKQQLKLHKEDFPMDSFSKICIKDAIFGLDLSQNIPREKGFCLADSKEVSSVS